MYDVRFITLPRLPLKWHAVQILDPSAGGDDNNPMSYPTAIDRVFGFPASRVATVDIREDSLAAHKRDYLDMSPLNPLIVITNPPFGLSMEFLMKSLDEMVAGG